MYRKATIEDCSAIYDLMCELENRELSFNRFQNIYYNQLHSVQCYCLVCDQDNRVLGVLNLRFEEQLHHAECIAEIMEFVVDSAFRNQGVGKGLLKQACRIAKEYGCSQIEVACNQLRKDTHRFYLREGLRNFHYKFSQSLQENDTVENTIGK